MTVEELQAVVDDQRKEIAHLRDMIASFDPELAAGRVMRMPLDDAEAIQHQLATQNWDVALLLKFEE